MQRMVILRTLNEINNAWVRFKRLNSTNLKELMQKANTTTGDIKLTVNKKTLKLSDSNGDSV